MNCGRLLEKTGEMKVRDYFNLRAVAMGRNEILSALREFKDLSGAAYGIIELGVFGSVARDEATETSDIDIFVKTVTPNPFMLVHIKHEIEGRLGQKVDIVRMREKMNPVLKGRIERDGVYV